MTVEYWEQVRKANRKALRDGSVKGGVQADAHVDGRGRWWSWGCSDCGEYDDQINTRGQARREYKEHKQICEREKQG